MHGYLVLRRARRVLGNENEAEDVLQEVFLSLLDKPAQFEGRSALTTWLYSATTHLCLNRLRNQRTRRAILERAAPPLASHPAPGAETMVALRLLLAQLPDAVARVAVYYYCDEMTQDEIARVMGCSRRHVGNLLERLSAAHQDAGGCV